jgi:PAS domain S-box-containing protein
MNQLIKYHFYLLEKKVFIILLSVCIVLPFLIGFHVHAQSTNKNSKIRVGIYHNTPLEDFKDGKAIGLYPDILNEIATKNNWKIEYVFGSWNEVYRMLLDGEIDLLPNIIYLQERDSLVDFNQETVLNMWGELFIHSNTKFSHITEIRKKNIGVLKGGANGSAFKKIISDFEIPLNYVEFKDYESMVKAVDKKEIYGGVINNYVGDFLMNHSNAYNIKEGGFAFAPNRLLFAVKKGKHNELLKTIDDQLVIWKADRSSFYYKKYEYWIKQNPESDYKLLLIIGGSLVSIVLLSLLWVYTLKKQIKIQLRKFVKSEKKFRELYEKSADAILVIVNYHFVDCNKATVKLLGYKTKEEFLNSHPSKLSPEFQADGKESMKKAERMMAIALEKGTNRFEWIHSKKNGETFPVEVLLTTISTEPDNTVIHCVWRDITDRKQNENLIVQSKKELELAHEVTRLGTFDFNTHDKTFTSSELFDEITGIDKHYNKDLKGWISLVHPEDQKNLNRLFNDPDIKNFDQEFRIIKPKDKKIIWVLGYARKFGNESENKHLIKGTIQDITQRKEHEVKIKQSDIILNKLSSLVFVNDAKGDITYASPSVKTILGYEVEEVMGEGWWQLTFDDQQTANTLKSGIVKHLYKKGKKPSSYNVRKVKTKSGEYKWIEWHISKGLNNTYISSGIDVTEKRRTEEVKQIIFNITKKAHETLNLEVLFNFIKSELGRLINTDNFFIALYNAKTDMISTPYMVDELDDNDDFPKGETLTGHVIDIKKSVLLDDNKIAEMRRLNLIKGLGPAAKCWLGVPLLIKDKAIGAIVVQSYKDNNAYIVSDVELLELIATNISHVIQNINDFEQINLLNQALVQSPQSILILSKKGKIQYANPAFILLSGYTSEEVIGHIPKILDKKFKLKKISDAIWNQLNNGNSWLGEFIDTHKNGSKYLLEVKISPVKNKQGEITHYISVGEDVTEKRQLERKFINAFVEAQEVEKQNFGQELHDGISQILSAETMYLDILLQLNKDRLNDKCQHLLKIKELNLSAVNEARSIAHGLMSKQLKLLGLLKAIENICVDYSTSKNIQFSYKQKNIKEEEIKKEVKTHLFRITQEISTNIIRHSGANKASINLSKINNNTLRLIVKDDGKGMDIDYINKENKGAGLKNIERRVTLLNGILKTDSAPNKGTIFTIDVPLISLN